MGCACHQAFIPPSPSLRFRKGFLLCRPPHRQHHAFRKTPLRSRLRALSRLGLPSLRVVAVQTSPISGDNDGELHEDQPAPQKSYSVGVTIVSGYDASLRRSIIEQIAAEYDVGRLVVVTSGGISYTEEPDTPGLEECKSNGVETEASSEDGAYSPKPDGDKLDGSDGHNEEFVDNVKHSTKPEGWISCSSTDEMAEVIAKLATSRECDYIVAEGSMDTNMEPQDFARLFRNRGGASLRVDTLVSVIDGNMLLNDLSAVPISQEQEDLFDNSFHSGDVSRLQNSNSPEGIQDLADTRPMTVVSLVENANVVVVRQAASSSGLEDISRARELVSVLNGAADIVSATEKDLTIDKLVNTNTYDHESVSFGATWKRVLLASRNTLNGSSRPTLPKSVKDATFVYRARRPFHPTRLYEHIKAVATFAGVIRSAGRIWLATRMLAPLEWNQAGVSATLRVGNLFWAAVPEEDWPTDDTQRQRIMEYWDTQYGDRETEIVFLGKGIDKPRLQGLLDGCLLQDEEMVFNNMWPNFDDPFVEWVPLIEDDEDVPLETEKLMSGSIIQESRTVSLQNSETDEYDEVRVGYQSSSDDEAKADMLSSSDVYHRCTEDEKEVKVTDLSSGAEEVDNMNSEESTNNSEAREGQTPAEVVDSVEEETHSEFIEEELRLEKMMAEGDTLSTSDETECRNEEGAALSRSPEVVNAVNNSNEGQISDSELPDDVMDRISALDIFEHASWGNESRLQPLPGDSEYDADEAIIASWEGSVADGILEQVPKGGLPVTIVTGFLGSGKTTLLNYILHEDHGLRIAVLVNEFGDIDIDSQLVESGDWSNKDEIMQLANGCICCNINDSFLNAVSKILERADDVDYLIVETTGLADPVPVINSLTMSEMATQVRLDGILTVVDADNFDPRSMESEAALSQIMAADTILLSKTDVAPTERVTRTIEYVKSKRPAARILRSQKGRVPIEMILDVGVRVADSPAHLNPADTKTEKAQKKARNDDDRSRTSALETTSIEETDAEEHECDHHAHSHTRSCEHEHENEHGSDCEHNSHEHNHSNHLEIDGFVTTSFKSDRPLDPEMFMDNFLRKLPEGVYRAKGLLCFHGYTGRYVFQLSGRRYQFEEDEWPEDVEPGNQLVIIGRDLDLDALKTTLGKCIV